MIAIVGLILIGPFGLYSWYTQTYTDSSSASLWRRMSTWLFIIEGVVGV